MSIRKRIEQRRSARRTRRRGLGTNEEWKELYAVEFTAEPTFVELFSPRREGKFVSLRERFLKNKEDVERERELRDVTRQMIEDAKRDEGFNAKGEGE